MKLGVFVILGDNVEQKFKELKDNGFSTCQLNSWSESLMNEEMAKRVNAAKEEYGIEITAFWCGWEGPQVWDFYEGPATLGLVPTAYRFDRMKTLKKGSDFAKMIGVNVSQVKKWIIGQSKPRYKNLKAICLALKIRADVVLGLKDK